MPPSLGSVPDILNIYSSSHDWEIHIYLKVQVY